MLYGFKGLYERNGPFIGIFIKILATAFTSLNCFIKSAAIGKWNLAISSFLRQSNDYQFKSSPNLQNYVLWIQGSSWINWSF